MCIRFIRTTVNKTLFMNYRMCRITSECQSNLKVKIENIFVNTYSSDIKMKSSFKCWFSSRLLSKDRIFLLTHMQTYLYTGSVQYGTGPVPSRWCHMIQLLVITHKTHNNNHFDHTSYRKYT